MDIYTLQEQAYKKGYDQALKETLGGDVVRVVRCKDCVHCVYDAMFARWWCKHTTNGSFCVREVIANAFCSYGEKKAGEGA